MSFFVFRERGFSFKGFPNVLGKWIEVYLISLALPLRLRLHPVLPMMMKVNLCNGTSHSMKMRQLQTFHQASGV